MPDVLTQKRKKIFLMKDYQVLRGQEAKDLGEEQFLDHVFGLSETNELCKPIFPFKTYKVDCPLQAKHKSASSCA